MLFHRQTDPDLTRAADDSTRTIEFVASSGNPVHTRSGPEYLRVSGMDLSRFRKNPVILDVHNRASCDDVIGRATVRKEGGQLLASIRFASDEKSDRIYQKVREGILNAVSIGFSVDPESVRQLADGETDGDGPDEIRGPGIVLNRSVLHEISVVPVPADEDALKREFYRRCANVKYTDLHSDDDEPEARAADQDPPAPIEVPPTPEVRAEPDATEDSLTDALDATIDAEKLRTEAEVAAARSAAREATLAGVRAICPQSLGEFLEDLILDQPDISFDDARRALLDERARTRKPVGTPDLKPEPKNPTPEPLAPGDLFTSLTGR